MPNETSRETGLRTHVMTPRGVVFLIVVVAGLILGTVEWYKNEREALDQILVTSETINLLTDRWTQQLGTEPTDADIEGLIDEYVVEEMLVREAIKLGLDTHDTIIRRRLIQKLEFVTRDTTNPVEPTEEELESYFRTVQARYDIPASLDFVHVFYSGDKRENPHADALVDLQTITTENRREYGDPFLLSNSYTEFSFANVRKEYGSRFETGLLQAEVGTWSGPVPSVYGQHLIYVSQRYAGREADFLDVIDQVLADYRYDKFNEFQNEYIEQLRSDYSVTIEE